MKKIKNCLLLLMLGIFLSSALIACTGENGVEREGKELKFDTVSKGFYSAQAEEEFFVIKDKDGFNQLLALIEKDNADAVDKGIDFSAEIIIGVFLGEKPTGGYDIEITGVLEKGNYIEVLYKVAEPDPDEMVIQSITSPYHIIKLERKDMEFVFSIVK
jgi:hypothetical protein